MIQKYTYGTPLSTDAVVAQLPAQTGAPQYGTTTLTDTYTLTVSLAADDIVYGLGEANRGINKRGYLYVSNCLDNPHHTEDQVSMYAAHNFIVVDGKETFGMYFDHPGEISFDIGYTRQDEMRVYTADPNFDLYVISGENAYDVVKQFRTIIGRSYIPPKFAFGFGQSRWGYQTQADFEKVAKGYRDNHIPLDMIYMDIDYMEHYKDFTVNIERFPDFEGFVSAMKDDNIRMIPIIDAGVKIEAGYDVYEEGVENDYFCKREDGSDFVAAVWPGLTHFPDVLNSRARAWFGSKYDALVSKGIEGFWNDMCEPAIFYTLEGIEAYKQYLRDDLLAREDFPDFDATTNAAALANNPDDYKRFYHNMDGTVVRHDRVHNLYGMNMTRSASEGLAKIAPGKRFLTFSRSSFIGAHRYGGVWTGDNSSWWSHILLNLKMMPSLNMCGFLYTGADLGGFGCNATRDLVLRWLALGVFTPLMRNHAALGTREQECYQFEHVEDFRHVVGVRYRLIPYIYSEFMKAALQGDMYCKPLAFVYPEDRHAREVEDQLMIGNEIMIAPVYTQNVTGRYVYLPEEMQFVKFLPDGSISQEVLPAGHHYVDIALNEVSLFIRRDHCIPIVDSAESVEQLDLSTMRYIGYPDAQYKLYDDDGVTIPE